jgi:transcriptional regulator
MYLPTLFHESDAGRLHDLIAAHPFGTLVASADGDVEIAHVPFLLDRDVAPYGRLRFHVARANPIARAAASGAPLVAVFHGPDAYVSASWYEAPTEQVPTWNYAVVHARGRASAPMTKDETRRLLDDLSRVHEAGSPAPWRMSALDPRFVDELLDEIVGFALPIERLDGKFKLSQNRSPQDRARVMRALTHRGGPDDLGMVGWME